MQVVESWELIHCAMVIHVFHMLSRSGVTDEEGEQTVRELGGQLVDSVFDCTHLFTDKVELWIEDVFFPQNDLL